MADAPLKPGDIVRTPSGRDARVHDLTADGRRELRYLDAQGGETVLHPRHLTLIHAAPVRGFRDVFDRPPQASRGHDLGPRFTPFGRKAWRGGR